MQIAKSFGTPQEFLNIIATYFAVNQIHVSQLPCSNESWAGFTVKLQIYKILDVLISTYVNVQCFAASITAS